MYIHRLQYLATLKGLIILLWHRTPSHEGIPGNDLIDFFNGGKFTNFKNQWISLIWDFQKSGKFINFETFKNQWNSLSNSLAHPPSLTTRQSQSPLWESTTLTLTVDCVSLGIYFASQSGIPSNKNSCFHGTLPIFIGVATRRFPRQFRMETAWN